MDMESPSTLQRLSEKTARAARAAAKFIAIFALGMAWAVLVALPWALRVGLVLAWFLVLLWAMMVWPSYLAPLSPAHAWTVRLMPLALAVLPLVSVAKRPKWFWGALALAVAIVYAATAGLRVYWARYAFYIVAALPVTYLALVFYFTFRIRAKFKRFKFFTQGG